MTYLMCFVCLCVGAGVGLFATCLFVVGKEDEMSMQRREQGLRLKTSPEEHCAEETRVPQVREEVADG